MTSKEVFRLLVRMDGGYVPNEDERRELEKRERLDLSNTDITKLPEAVGELKNLHRLYLGNTRIAELPEAVGELKNLQGLALSGTRITELPEAVGELKNLQWLYLNDTHITELPEAVGELKNLQELYLGGTRITEVPEAVGELKNLQWLDLRNAPITELPKAVGELKNLQGLWLGDTHITKLSEAVGELPELKRLDLRNLTLDRIPRSLAMKGLPFIDDIGEWLYKDGVYVRGLTLTEQPLSVFTQTPELIYTLYEEEKLTIRESKVIFLGDGGTGKSYTIKRFVNGGRRETKDAPYLTSETPGVEIISYPVERGEDSFNISFWDFGGQEILHSMHRCFLTEQTCYVVVITTRHEKPNQRVRYWMRNISVFAPTSPVLLLVNCWEDDEVCNIDEGLLRRDYPNIRAVVRCSAKYGEDGDFQRFMEQVIEMASRSGGCTQKVPKSWNDLRLALIREEGNYIDKKRYYELCKENGVKDADAAGTLTFFNNLGVCISYHKDEVELTDYKLLEPPWLTKAIYGIIRECMNFAHSGIIKISAITETLGNPPHHKIYEREYTRPTYTEEECGYVIKVAAARSLCYKLDDERLFFPALCRDGTPLDRLPGESEYPHHIRYRMKYKYLPDSVVHQLMIRCYVNDISLNECWRDGMLAGNAPGQKALIRMTDDDTTLSIDIYSKDGQPSHGLFRLLRDEILSINSGLNLSAREYIADGEDRFTVNSLLGALKGTGVVYGDESGAEKDARELLGQFYDEWSISRMCIAENGSILIPIRKNKYHYVQKNDESLRQALCEVYRWRCMICNKPIRGMDDLEVDHIFPVKYDKNDQDAVRYRSVLADQGMEKLDCIENYIPAHKSCNGRKSNGFDPNWAVSMHNIALNNSKRVRKEMEKNCGKQN